MLIHILVCHRSRAEAKILKYLTRSNCNMLKLLSDYIAFKLCGTMVHIIRQLVATNLVMKLIGTCHNN